MGNSKYNTVLELIYKVLGNLVRNYNVNKTYFDEDNLRPIVLTAVAFKVCLAENRLKYYSPDQLIFGRDIILLINKQWMKN